MTVVVRERSHHIQLNPHMSFALTLAHPSIHSYIVMLSAYSVPRKKHYPLGTQRWKR